MIMIFGCSGRDTGRFEMGNSLLVMVALIMVRFVETP